MFFVLRINSYELNQDQKKMKTRAMNYKENVFCFHITVEVGIYIFILLIMLIIFFLQKVGLNTVLICFLFASKKYANNEFEMYFYI